MNRFLSSWWCGEKWITLATLVNMHYWIKITFKTFLNPSRIQRRSISYLVVIQGVTDWFITSCCNFVIWLQPSRRVSFIANAAKAENILAGSDKQKGLILPHDNAWPFQWFFAKIESLVYQASFLLPLFTWSSLNQLWYIVEPRCSSTQETAHKGPFINNYHFCGREYWKNARNTIVKRSQH